MCALERWDSSTPKLHGKKARVYLNGFDVSNYFTSAEAPQTGDTAETSGFGDEDKTYVVGQKSGTIRLSGFFDNDAAAGTEKRFVDVIQAATNPIVTVVSESLAERRGWAAAAIETSLAKSAAIGAVAAMNAEFISDSGVFNVRTVFARGTLGASTAPGGTLSSYNGGTATTKGIVGVLHVFGSVSGTPVYTIQDSADGSSGWATVVTFAGVASAQAPQAQIVEVTGTVRAFLRANVTAGTADVYIGAHQPI